MDANQARELSKLHDQNELKNQFDYFISEIKSACEEGKYSVILIANISEGPVLMLRKLEYEVTYLNESMGTIEIKW